MKGDVRRMFPGGNTALGFYSYYRYLSPENASRVFIFKGGPGTGKSRFMKEIAREMIDMGCDVELHQCSSDNASLDGIVIPILNIAFIDGTDPHIVDPQYPGYTDEIINLGEYWDAEILEANKDYITKHRKEISRLFSRAYKYLGAAKEIMDDLEEKYGNAMDYGKVNIIIEALKQEVFKDWTVSAVRGRERHLFGSAFTPLGFVDYADTVLDKINNVYYIKGQPGTGKTGIMSRIGQYAVDRGFKAEYFHAPLKPHKVESVVIKDINVAVTCSNKACDFCIKKIDLNDFMNPDVLSKDERILAQDWAIYYTLIDEAVLMIAKAKEVHDKVEEYYVSAMDFERIDVLMKSIIKKIKQYF